MGKIIILFLIISTALSAQITGVVKGVNGKVLPFVNVYIKGTTLGTSTNDNGFYQLSSPNLGTQTIVFQFLGYKTFEQKIIIEKFPYQFDVVMIPQTFVLDEVEVIANENPSTRIIKRAILSKDKNTNHLQNFTADFYSKGLIRIKNAPEKLMGKKLTFPFPLDKTRSGIIYLSETVSKITSQRKPKRFKEQIIASKVSGKDNGLSFNQAEDVDFNPYANIIDIAEVDVVSPIANYAFEYYRYQFGGTFYDNHGNLINKIKIIPKLKNNRTFDGYIYIVEGSWAVYGIEFEITGRQLSNPAIDTLIIKQDYKFNSKQKEWVLLLQTIDFKAGMFGVNVNGSYSSSYKNYKFVSKFKKKTFTNEVLSFDEKATKKDSIYWGKLRPIPLTPEEKKDYVVKDSIKIITTSEKYKDSVDVHRNQFSILDVVLGYTYRNSFDKWEIGYDSPINTVNFNTVQGWNVKMGGYFLNELNNVGKWYRIKASVNYGFSEKCLRPEASFTYKFNNLDKPVLGISTGISGNQFDSKEPISNLYNSLSTLFFERNYMKIYEKKFVNFTFANDIFNGFRLYTEFETMERNPLFNTTNYTVINYDDRSYTTNNPIEKRNPSPSFEKHKIWRGQLSARIRFANKYISLPDEKFDMPNDKYPELRLTYRKMFWADNSKLNSDLFIAKISQITKFGKFGDFRYDIKSGIFLEKKDIAYMDYLHPNGNRIPIVSSAINQLNLLNYYVLGTNDKQSEWGVEHNFRGFVLSKIPLLNKLNFHLIAGGKALFTADRKPYTEYSVGLGNLGIGKWRFLRVDYVRSYFGHQRNGGFVFGLQFLD